jgi:hypothetical protein
MIAQTKDILISLLALVIGIASVLPLAVFMCQDSLKPFVDVEAVLGNQSPLNFNLTYAYIGDYWNNNSNVNDGNYGWKYHINFRTLSKIDVDDFNSKQYYAAYEYYLFEVSTEDGAIATLGFESHVYSPAYRTYNSSTYPDFASQQWFTNITTNQMTDAAHMQGPSMALNGTAYGQLMGSASDWNIANGKPETIILKVRLVGWVIINNNSTTVHYGSSEPIAEVQLQNYGNGFLYNKLFTPDELTQINPVMPQFKFMR